MVMNRWTPFRIVVLVTWGIGLHPDLLMAQVSDSLAYLELLHGDALSADVLESEGPMDNGASALYTSRRTTDPSGPGALSWNAVLASSGRLAVNGAWSPAPWLAFAGSMLREAAEPVRLDLGAQWFLGEHSSGFVRIGGRRFRLILGDFRFRSAGAFSTLGLRTSEPSRQHPWRPTIRMPDVRPYSGASQHPAPRGVALSWSGNGDWSMDVFTSTRREEGSVNAGIGTHPVQQTSLRKSWRLTSPTSLSTRRRVRLQAHGGSVRMARGPLRAGTSWSWFSVPGTSRTLFESMGRLHWSTSRSGARTGFIAARIGLTPAAGALSSWTLETSIPLGNLTWNLHHRHEQADAPGPWGPDAGMEPRDHARRTTVASVATHPAKGVAMVWGIRHHHRSPSRRRQPDVHQAAAWIHAAGRTWSMELRVKNERDPVTGTWNGRTRLSIRKESAVGSRVFIRVNAVAARAGGLGARVQWMACPETRIVAGRTVIWGHDSDPWAVLATDRVTGMLGMLRMTGPTVQWSFRLERSLARTGQVTLFMDQRSQRDPFTGTLDYRRRLVVALRY